ncbi:MAG: SDR family NAD(P)-dependent oxidoreductase [Polyangiaceae bacterium]|nr:SDR family NAD(P)-dependent oxidoreductase [Polyangiaceae bacterium]
MAQRPRHVDPRLRVALVTGACSGIGRAFAERLASFGFELILVSNRAAPLATAAREIVGAHGVRVHQLVSDLSRPEAAAELHEGIGKRGVAVDVLVNNAGTFFFGEVVDTDPGRARAMLELHVVTPSLLTAAFGRDMRERGYGHILIVSSISAWRDFPGIAHYGASKRYLRGFASALRSELGVYGVKVTCLAPGPTATSLFGASDATRELAKRLGIMVEPATVADAGLLAMFAGRAEHIPGILAHLMAWGAAWTPQWVVDLIRRRAPWLPVRGGVR